MAEALSFNFSKKPSSSSGFFISMLPLHWCSCVCVGAGLCGAVVAVVVVVIVGGG